MTRYRTVSEPVMVDPVLVTAFDGWVNAANAATGAVEFLIQDSSEVVVFDSDDLFDYRDTRPTLNFEAGVPRQIDHPRVAIWHRSYDERHLLVLTGTEPSLGWRSFTSTVADLATGWGVSEVVVLGGIPWAVPHTRPVTLITTASSIDRIPEAAEHPDGILQVPASVNGAIELELMGRDVPTIGFYARVPNYLGAEFTAATHALLDQMDTHLGLGLDLSGLAADADSQRIHLDAIADNRPDVKSMIEQLESLVDGATAVSGDQIASEIERFLRNRGDDATDL